MRILVTGGLGYIGSHTCVELCAAGHEVVAIDNLVNSKAGVADRVARITGMHLDFRDIDVRDKVALDSLFAEAGIEAVIHFAGLKAVGESVREPLRYFDNNVNGTLVLLAAMAKANVKTLVFSSSATVYGDPQEVPILENFPLKPTNPYGRSKLMVEEILRDLAVSDASWKIALLRYFNPVGAHESGLIGEDPNGIPNNLLPYIAQVAEGRRERLGIFGNDYATPDGTGVRDYIHVVDLALGHVKTLDKLQNSRGVLTYNLGTGSGHSVLEMVKAFESASGKKIPYEFAPRRPGDITQCFADSSLAAKELGWYAKRGIDQMCADTWRWQDLSARSGW